MKLLLDMGISPKCANFLRELGHDAVHLGEERLHRATDQEVVRKARQEERVILTHDLDFGAIMATTGARLPSVVIFRLGDMRSDNVNRHLAELLTHHTQSLIDGAIISVREGQVRVRVLPIGEGGEHNEP